jgi:hypothetical protein
LYSISSLTVTNKKKAPKKVVLEFKTKLTPEITEMLDKLL